MTPFYLHRSWLWLTERAAVERLRTGWLGDAWRWLADVVRGRGRGTGLHVLPAGMRLDLPYEWQSVPRRITAGGPPWEVSPPLAALPPVPDRLDAMVAEFAASLPSVSAPGTSLHGHGGELTPGQRAGYWQPRDVIPARVIAALENASAVDTVVPRSAPAVLTAYVEQLVGGSPYDRTDDRDEYIEALFAPIKARADEAIARIRASLAVA